VDFSQVAIDKARQYAAHDTGERTRFLVGDVTHLDALTGPFDYSFDVGCFHCLGAAAQRGYVSEVSRLLEPGGTHLIWALDGAPSGNVLSPEVVSDIFAPSFELQKATTSRRRLARSHWYWLVRSPDAHS
jgi:cyclopropane fatty-acyl-phospholipid synthase-like methyltransferase